MSEEEERGAADPNADQAVEAEGVEQEEGEESGESENRRARRAAASRARKNRLRERKEAEAVGLDAQEMLDDAIVRSQDSAGKWFRKNWSGIQWTIVVGLVGWGGWGLYDLQMAKAKAAASDALSDAVAAENGRVEKEPAESKDDKAIVDPTPVYETDELRLADARKKLEAATLLRDGSGTHAFGQLALASVLLDQAKFDEAKALYDTVASHPLAASYPELRGRAIDGAALALEGKGDSAGALSLYQKLEQANIDGFSALALMQQVRLNLALDKTDDAKAVLKKLNEKLGPPTTGNFPSYPEQAAKVFSEDLDPEAIQPAKITQDRIKELQAQMQRQVNQKAREAAATASAAASATAVATGAGKAPPPSPAKPPASAPLKKAAPPPKASPSAKAKPNVVPPAAPKAPASP